MELDLLDKRILLGLDKDCKTTYKRLAKQNRTSPEVVRYRISRLVERGIIKDFMVLTNFYKLGYIGCGVFCRLRSEKDKEMRMSYLKSHQFIYWIAEFGGHYDLAFAVMAPDILEFYKIFNEIKKNTEDFLTGFEVAIRIQLNQFPRRYLVEDVSRIKNVPYFGRELAHENIDEIDFWILKALSQRARTETLELSESIGLPPSTVSFRINRLKGRKIIQGFAPQIVCQNFGYSTFQIFIEVENLDDNKRTSLFRYCIGNSSVIFLIETLGVWNFEIIYEVKEQKDLQIEMAFLRKSFSWIRKMEEAIIFDNYVKYDQFPLNSYKSLKALQ